MNRTSSIAHLSLVLSVAAACSGGGGDASNDAAPDQDARAASTDAALVDAAVPDAAFADAATPDGAIADASLPDASLPDAALTDAGAGTLFFEDFEGGALPAGFVFFDVDGLTPDPNVASLGFDGTSAWIVRADLAEIRGMVAISTSWYTPVGTADDWMITPAIALGPLPTTLSWVAQAPDVNFPDGYEVRVSTTDATVDGCMANPAAAVIAAEEPVFTPRSVDLSAAGFTDQTVHICFRNNSDDKYTLQIDDILVETTATP